MPRDRLEETEDFPRIFVMDGRVSGSITLGRSRLAIWAITCELVANGWKSAARDYYPEPDDPAWGNYPDEQEVADFLYHLLEQRGEFARLLCVLADEDRRDSARQDRAGFFCPRWMEMPRRRARVKKALKACLAEIEAAEKEATDA